MCVLTNVWSLACALVVWIIYCSSVPIIDSGRERVMRIDDVSSHPVVCYEGEREGNMSYLPDMLVCFSLFVRKVDANNWSFGLMDGWMGHPPHSVSLSGPPSVTFYLLLCLSVVFSPIPQLNPLPLIS